jgi:2-polyprenyl-3-methyl-5-hydroxy-6-metoxy-1,4-benzoquinol methylase
MPQGPMRPDSETSHPTHSSPMGADPGENRETLQTRERQYQRHVELREQLGLVRMGMCASQTWRDDPKRLIFVLARYKFVAKMFSGLERVLEIGCGDTFGTKIVRQEVGHVTAIDFDPLFIDSAKETSDPAWPIETFVHDILVSPFGGQFSAAYSLDVLEHIPPDLERTFVENISASVCETGAVILGSPSLESQPYASPLSKAGHVNCKDHAGLKKLLQTFFHNVFIFSMNDEIVHTGFSPLAHYRLALCCGKRR